MSSPCDVCRDRGCYRGQPPCLTCIDHDDFNLAPKYAAGPDMLEALELVEQVDGPDRTYLEMRSTMEKARAAIAKAKGES